MCTFLVLMIPESADFEHAKAVAEPFGFELQEIGYEPHLPKVWNEARLLAPDNSHCKCGTSLGRSYREPRRAEAIEKKARRGRRARWSKAKQQAWIDDQLGTTGTAPNISRGANPELDRWLDLAKAALADPRVGRIGVVVQEYDERTDHWQPAAELVASHESLQMLPRVTPTWLV